jgi:hypothetical protein
LMRIYTRGENQGAQLKTCDARREQRMHIA